MPQPMRDGIAIDHRLPDSRRLASILGGNGISSLSAAGFLSHVRNLVPDFLDSATEGKMKRKTKEWLLITISCCTVALGSGVVSPSGRADDQTETQGAVSGGTTPAQTKLPPAATLKVDFVRDVQPILSQKCHSCHGAEAQQAGLRLDRRQNALRGGDYGPVIVPGNSAESELIRRVVTGDGGLQMPPTGPLTDEEIGILRAWIDQGVDFRIEVQEDAPATPVDPRLANLLTAVRSGAAGIVEKLIAEAPDLVNARDQEGSTPLHHAAGFGSTATIKLLLDKGADVNAANRRKSTPLFWAIHDEAKVRLLLERGADINAKTVDGLTLMYQAAAMGNATSLLRLLLDKGASADTRTLVGTTPLMIAAGRANLEVMGLLLEQKADVNARNSAGTTPLMNAASTGDPRAIRMLLQKGADARVRTSRTERRS